MSVFDHALLTIKIYQDSTSSHLVRAVMDDRAPGHLDRVRNLIKPGLIAGSPTAALAHADVAGRDNLMKILEILGSENLQNVGAEGGAALRDAHVAAIPDHVRLVIELHGIGTDIERTAVGGQLKRLKRALLTRGFLRFMGRGRGSRRAGGWGRRRLNRFGNGRLLEPCSAFGNFFVGHSASSRGRGCRSS